MSYVYVRRRQVHHVRPRPGTDCWSWMAGGNQVAKNPFYLSTNVRGSNNIAYVLRVQLMASLRFVHQCRSPALTEVVAKHGAIAANGRPAESRESALHDRWMSERANERTNNLRKGTIAIPGLERRSQIPSQNVIPT